ncbi:RHS repeat domain-containing protein [Flavivirga algicola]|uniref:RHS repeat-associated core domain-containing protein n=1 Tax=Flavivirga algicola TaxID=2729136 RepID=A0ABX1RV09_9FLAO|nr:RHS repeat-associated core domain-containing protein [Flavivirga algicola]NMH87390.1 RHS repeat-associated core domain-containing protein [Flavivirga algicola]
MMNRSHAYYGGDDAEKLQRRYHKHYSAITGTEIVEDTQMGSVKIITYVSGDAYSAPIAHIKRTVDVPIDEYHYLHRDYLGSILAITDGDVIEERQFGAWGSVDKFLDISTGGTVFNHQSLLGRGYTGHEHFFEVSLIHMNGRMYDPQLGRFLSPDNYIQEPFNTQNYNRYGYVLNNPLMYTDPTGELFGGEGDGILGGFVNLLWSSLKSLFGGYDPPSGGNQNAVIPSHYYMVDGSRNASIQPPGKPNPEHTFDPPVSQDNTSFLEGWNRTVSRFNNNFWGSFQDFMNKPIQGAANYINQTMLGVAQLTHDVVPGLSGVTGIENKTGNAIVAAGETISNIPNMTNEQLGSLSGGTSIFAMQFLVTRKMSVSNGFSSLNRANLLTQGIRRFSGDAAVTHFTKHANSVMSALGKKSYNLTNYLDDANHVIKNGTFVPELNGYVRLIGGQGSAKFGFVGD